MTELLPFFIILFAAVFFSELFIRFHFPWVVALILGGMLIGPSGLGWFQTDFVMDFLGEIGLIFLMFMAGLESHLLKKRHKNHPLEAHFKIAFFSSVIPFVVATVAAHLLGFSTVTTIFIGIIFISSSVAAIIPTLESKDLLRCKLGRTIVASVVISDILSLIALSVVLQLTSPSTQLPLLVFYPLLAVTLLLLRWLMPKVFLFFKTEAEHSRDLFRQELRSVFVMLIGTILAFQFLGLHPIVAGFFAGVVLSGSIKTKIMQDNIRSISYGIFIPIFFILIGSKTDIFSLLESPYILTLSILLIVIAIGSKLLSGYLGGISTHLSKQESIILGAATVPQLSTTLAVAFTGLELGILSQEIVTALVVVSIVTTIVGSFLLRLFSKNYIREEAEALDEEDDDVLELKHGT